MKLVNIKVLEIKHNVYSQEVIKKDRAMKEESRKNSKYGFVKYTGGFGKGDTGHTAIVEYEYDNGIKRQYEKSIFKNTKGFYIKYRGSNKYISLEYAEKEE